MGLTSQGKDICLFESHVGWCPQTKNHKMVIFQFMNNLSIVQDVLCIKVFWECGWFYNMCDVTLVISMLMFALLVCMFRSLFKRSWSDGNILRENRSPTSTPNINKDFRGADFSSESKRRSKMLSESTPDMCTSESDLAYSRCFTFLMIGWFV